MCVWGGGGGEEDTITQSTVIWYHNYTCSLNQLCSDLLFLPHLTNHYITNYCKNISMTKLLGR